MSSQEEFGLETELLFQVVGTNVSSPGMCEHPTGILENQKKSDKPIS